MLQNVLKVIAFKSNVLYKEYSYPLLIFTIMKKKYLLPPLNTIVDGREFEIQFSYDENNKVYFVIRETTEGKVQDPQLTLPFKGGIDEWVALCDENNNHQEMPQKYLHGRYSLRARKNLLISWCFGYQIQRMLNIA